MKRIDLTGKQVGKLKVIRYLPKEERTMSEYSGAVWLCECECGNEVEVRSTYLTGTGNYTQTSCGCTRKMKNFLATTKVETSEEFLKQFEDFDKVLFIHRALMRTSGLKILGISTEDFENFIKYFYNDLQFNKVYLFWKKNEYRGNTFYDYAKPSLDHKIPKSKEGTNNLENLHFITVFENLAKRDMTWEEWIEFKEKTNTTSHYFVDSIIEEGGKDNE